MIVALRSALLTLAALSVGLAIHKRDGEYWPASINWIGMALAMTLAAVLLPARRLSTSRDWTGSLQLYAVLLTGAVQLALMLFSPASGWNEWSDDLVDKEGPNLALYYSGLTAAVALLLLMMLFRKRWWGYPFVVLLGVHLMLGFWMIRSSPNPKIDVFMFQQEAARALKEGRNPYLADYPDIYADTPQAADRAVYGQGLSKDGKLAFGFPYPPESLLVSSLGVWANGDHRYAQAVCLTLAGLLIAMARPGSFGAISAVVLLFTPRAFFILGRGWTEPIVIFFLALLVFTAYRLPRWLPLTLALFLASKQYLIFAVPLAWLLIPGRRDWKVVLWFFGLTFGIVALITLPPALRDWSAFWNSTVTVQQMAPFREDALSYLVWYFQKTGVKLDAWVAFVVAVPCLALALWRCPRSPAGFCMGLAAVYLPFIAFNKQAFANYYLFVIAAMVFAVGLTPNWGAAVTPVISPEVAGEKPPL